MGVVPDKLFDRTTSCRFLAAIDQVNFGYQVFPSFARKAYSLLKTNSPDSFFFKCLRNTQVQPLSEVLTVARTKRWSDWECFTKLSPNWVSESNVTSTQLLTFGSRKCEMMWLDLYTNQYNSLRIFKFHCVKAININAGNMEKQKRW